MGRGILSVAPVLVATILAMAMAPLSAQQPLAVTVAYPAEGAVLFVGDSTFLFGRLSDSRARLEIGGVPVTVDSGGGWLAWVPLPGDSMHRFEVVARLDGREVRTTRRVVRGDWVPGDRPAIIPTSLYPVGDISVPTGEALQLSVRTSPGTTARLITTGAEPIAFAPSPPPFDQYGRALNSFGPPDAVRKSGDAVYQTAATTAAIQTGQPVLELVRGRDTVRVPWSIRLARREVAADLVRLHDDPAGTGGTDGMVHATTVPGGAYVWRWPNGTVALSDGRLGDLVRVRLPAGAHALVPRDQVEVVRSGVAADPATVGSIAVIPVDRGVEILIPVDRPVPTDVVVDGSGAVILLHGATASADWIRFQQQTADRLMIVPSQQGETVRLDVTSDGPIWGHRIAVRNGHLVVTLREPPKVDPAAPLAGLQIAIDAGHPPGGSCGPLGYCEPVANMTVAQLVAAELGRAGAAVVLTRADGRSMPLERRIAIADSASVDLMVSIHHNGLPDGIRPHGATGTTTFFYHPGSRRLALAVQRSLVTRLGLPDLGVARGDLALARPSWFPAILTEGMHLMEPSQERLARSRSGQEAYAAGIAEGIRRFIEGELLSTPRPADRLR